MLLSDPPDRPQTGLCAHLRLEPTGSPRPPKHGTGPTSTTTPPVVQIMASLAFLLKRGTNSSQMGNFVK